MRLTYIAAQDYRNLADHPVEPGPRFNVLSGDNAQGKTNFLEAVSLLCGQRSFRANRTAELIALGHSEAHVQGHAVVNALQRTLSVHLRADGGRRVLVDGKAARAGSARLEGLCAVLFSPEDLQVPRGGPSERRRLIDQAIELLWPAFAALQRDYGRALQSRNRLLRDQPRDLSALLEVYEQQLSELGAKLTAARRRFLVAIGTQYTEACARILQRGPGCELSYQAPPDVLDAGHDLTTLQQALSASLRRRRSEDLARKSTSVGPHVDDVAFLIGAQPARGFASQGQVRSMVLGFKITQIINITQKLGTHPLLLLDDVSSELDAARNTYLFDFIETIDSQVFLTTTRPELIPPGKNIVYFRVVNGTTTPVADPLPGRSPVLPSHSKNQQKTE